MTDDNETRSDSAIAPPAADAEGGQVSLLETLIGSERFQTEVLLSIERDYQAAKTDVLARYSELREELERSFQTPQLGKYHKEGSTMESHLALMLYVIKSLQERRADEVISDPKTRQMLIDTVQKKPEFFRDYTFLHDIKKPDCMMVTLEEGNEKKEITWEEWLEIKGRGEPYQLIKEGRSVPITNIGYYQQSAKKQGNHGNLAVDLLENKLAPGSLDPDMVMAIGMHEAAFQNFLGISAAKYEQYYGDLSDDQMNIILTASCVDFAGSLGEDGRPDFTPLLNVLASRNNLLLISRFQRSGAEFESNELKKLREAARELNERDVHNARITMKTYEEGELRSVLDTLKINDAQKNAVVSHLVTGQPVDAKALLKARELGSMLRSYKTHVLVAIKDIGTDTFTLFPA